MMMVVIVIDGNDGDDDGDALLFGCCWQGRCLCLVCFPKVLVDFQEGEFEAAIHVWILVEEDIPVLSKHAVPLDRILLLSIPVLARSPVRGGNPVDLHQYLPGA